MFRADCWQLARFLQTSQCRVHYGLSERFAQPDCIHASYITNKCSILRDENVVCDLFHREAGAPFLRVLLIESLDRYCMHYSAHATL